MTAVQAPLALEAIGVTKRFGSITANDDVDLQVEAGTVHALLGENGAGKSTLVNILFGLYHADEGEIRVAGKPVRMDSPRDAIAHRIGMVHQHFQLVPVLTVAENVVLGQEPTRGLGVLDLDAAAAEVTRLAERYGLDVDPRAVVEDLPVGTQQRVEILRSLYRQADVLILDEPTDGLDPNQKHEVRNLISEMSAEKAIVISTHILEEVDAVCSRAIIIADGRIVADGTPAELEQQSPFHNAVLIDSPDDGLAEALEAMANVALVEELQGGRFRAYPKDGQTIVVEIADLIRRRGWSTSRLSVEPPRLDEVFRNYTKPKGKSGGKSDRGKAA